MGKVILKSGSYIAPTEGGGCFQNIKRLRDRLKVKDNILQEDVECSLNESASVIIGGSLNVWNTWEDKDGNKIDIYIYIYIYRNKGNK